MKISIFGTGYVGLVTGVCFAEMGNDVLCMDIDPAKIELLKSGKTPIYEQGITELLQRNTKEGRLRFTTDGFTAVQESDLIFIAVGTPPKPDGSPEMQYVLNLADSIGKWMNGPKTIVTKSTVPVGSNDLIRVTIEKSLNWRNKHYLFEVISNPEFLREGSAIEDCLNPDRIIVGTSSENGQKLMRRLYDPFIKNGAQFLLMDIRSAELAKYASNCMLAAKISIMNEFSRLCEKLGANIEHVRTGLGADHRIGPHFIYPGIGYGGSCFPKDIDALIHLGHVNNENLEILSAVSNVNKSQRQRFVTRTLANLQGSPKKIAVWGVAFKPGTDDIREAPAMFAIREFLNAGHKVIAFDSVASKNALAEIGHRNFEFKNDQYETLIDADALCIFTEWTSFREPDFNKMKGLMNKALVFDGRNLWAPEMLSALGFQYFSIGRPPTFPEIHATPPMDFIFSSDTYQIREQTGKPTTSTNQ